MYRFYGQPLPHPFSVTQKLTRCAPDQTDIAAWLAAVQSEFTQKTNV
jgi:hypothetical protein